MCCCVFPKGKADRNSNKTRGVNLSTRRESYPRPRSHGSAEHPNIEGSASTWQKTWGVETAPKFKNQCHKNASNLSGQTMCKLWMAAPQLFPAKVLTIRLQMPWQVMTITGTRWVCESSNPIHTFFAEKPWKTSRQFLVGGFTPLKNISYWDDYSQYIPNHQPDLH